MFTGDPMRFGFPEARLQDLRVPPDRELAGAASLGHGDITVRPDVARFDGRTRALRRRLARRRTTWWCSPPATRLHYPFVDQALLNWQGWSPRLYLQRVRRRASSLCVLGMIEAVGHRLAGPLRAGRAAGALLQALARHGPRPPHSTAAKVGPAPDLSGGYHYLQLGADGLLREQGRLSPQPCARRPRRAGAAPRTTSTGSPHAARRRGSAELQSRLAGRANACWHPMFGIALDTRIEDFRRRRAHAAAIAIGIARAVHRAAGHHVRADAAAAPCPSRSRSGMILVACCPPGNVSHILTHRAGGNVALSVSMTAVSQRSCPSSRCR